MDLQENTRPLARRARAHELDADKLVSLPAWQAARTRIDQYLALLDVPMPLRTHWSSVAFARALRQRGMHEPVRAAMRELQGLLAEHDLSAPQLAHIVLPTPGARRTVIGIQRTPVRPASLEADIVRRIMRRVRAWFAGLGPNRPRRD